MQKYKLNEIVKVNVNNISPYHLNCKKHNRKNIEAIKKSIKMFNQYKPLIVNSRTNEILIGNGTYQALKELDYSEIYAIFIDVDEKKEKVLNLADNKLSTLSTWNENLLDKISSFDEDFIKTLDFNDKFLNSLIKKNGTIEKKAGPIISDEFLVTKEAEFIKCPCCGREFQKC